MGNIGQKTHSPTRRHALWKLAQLWKSKSVASHLFMDDFHRCLEKPPLKNALRLSHSCHSAGPHTHHKERKRGTIFLTEEAIDGGYGNP